MKSDWRDFALCGLFIAAILAASVTVVWLIRPWTMVWFGAYHVLVDAAAGLIGYGLLSGLVVRALLKLKPLPPGTYTMDHPILTYWKLLTILYRLGQGALNWCTPIFAKPVLDALFGARIGSDAAFGGTIDDPYMVTIGNGVILGNASLVSANYLSSGQLTCGPIRIGNGATIGANAVLLPNTEIGDGATVMSGSYVMPGTTINAGEVWRGNPARRWSASPAAPAGGVAGTATSGDS